MPGPTTGDVPSGATMQPRYMGRTMIMYPVSETELENISSLSGQVTFRFSLTTLFLGLAASIWTNAVFYTELTPAGVLAAHFVGPVLLALATVCGFGGCYSIWKRKSAWDTIKRESLPVPVTALVEVVAAQ
jgi:hypothetical protein